MKPTQAFKYVALISALLLVGCNDGIFEADDTIPPSSNLESIQIDAINPLLGVSGDKVATDYSVQYQAIGSYSDGSQVDITDDVEWNSSDIEAASINGEGIATGIQAGETDISSSVSDVESTVSPLSVIDTALISLELQGREVTTIDLPIPFEAYGVFDNGTQQQLTEFVSWHSNNPSIADFNTELKGELIPESVGATDVTATYESVGVSSVAYSTHVVGPEAVENIYLSVSPVQSAIIIGSSVDYSVMANIELIDGFPDMAPFNVTGYMDFEAQEPDVVGLEPLEDVVRATGLKLSTGTVITASTTLNGDTYTRNAELKVIDPTDGGGEGEIIPDTVTMLCDETVIVAGTSTQCSMVATFSDVDFFVTEDSTWSSSDESIAVVGNTALKKGVVDGNAPGEATIAAGYRGMEDAQQITVTDAVPVAVTITNESPVVNQGSTLEMIANVKLSDGGVVEDSQDVVWSITGDGSIATIDPETGIVTGTSESDEDETEEVTVTLDGYSDSEIVTVVKASLEMCGTGVDDTDISNAAGVCLKVTSFGGKLFTGTPSKALGEYLGYEPSLTIENSGRTYANAHTFGYEHNEPFLTFYKVGKDVVLPGEGDDENAGVGGQYDRWCKDLNSFKFAGQTNWRTSEYEEMLSFLQDKGDMYINYGWSSGEYWTDVINNPPYLPYHYLTVDGYLREENVSVDEYLRAMCVSDGN